MLHVVLPELGAFPVEELEGRAEGRVEFIGATKVVVEIYKVRARRKITCKRNKH